MRRLAECALAYQRGVGAWAREVSRLPLHGTHWGFRIQLRAFGWAWREILQYGCHTLRGQDSVPLRTEQRRRNGFRKEQDPCMGGSAARRNGVRCHDLGHRLACFDGPPRPPAISLYLGALQGIALHWRCQWRVALRHKVNAAGRELVCGKGARAREWCALLARVAIDRCILGSRFGQQHRQAGSQRGWAALGFRIQPWYVDSCDGLGRLPYDSFYPANGCLGDSLRALRLARHLLFSLLSLRHLGCIPLLLDRFHAPGEILVHHVSLDLPDHPCCDADMRPAKNHPVLLLRIPPNDTARCAESDVAHTAVLAHCNGCATYSIRYLRNTRGRLWTRRCRYWGFDHLCS